MTGPCIQCGYSNAVMVEMFIPKESLRAKTIADADDVMPKDEVALVCGKCWRGMLMAGRHVV